ncbi:MAG: pentapeptide repeat-containing protein [Microthrixaceae bacterium]
MSKKFSILVAALCVVLLAASCRLAPNPGTSHSPSGYVDVVSGGNGTVRVQGWASDWDTLASIQVAFLVNGEWVPGFFDANKTRTDVGARYRRGNNFGFDETLPAPAGVVQVCVAAINVGRGENTVLPSCETTSSSPVPTTTVPTSTTTTVAPTTTTVAPVDCTARGPGVDLSGCDLTQADLVGLDLTGANLNGTILFNADLSDATLTGANMTGADLEFAIVERTFLINVDLTDANLRNANLGGSNLSGAILTGVIWFNTTCPDETNSNANSPQTCEIPPLPI